MISGVNVCNSEERREISSLERKRLEGIIIGVSKTLMNTEKGETGNDSKAKKDINRRNKELSIKENSETTYLHSNYCGPQKRLQTSEGQHPNLECIFTMSQMSPSWGGVNWGWGMLYKAQNLHGGIDVFVRTTWLLSFLKCCCSPSLS